MMNASVLAYALHGEKTVLRHLNYNYNTDYSRARHNEWLELYKAVSGTIMGELPSSLLVHDSNGKYWEAGMRAVPIYKKCNRHQLELFVLLSIREHEDTAYSVKVQQDMTATVHGGDSFLVGVRCLAKPRTEASFMGRLQSQAVHDTALFWAESEYAHNELAPIPGIPMNRERLFRMHAEKMAAKQENKS